MKIKTIICVLLVFQLSVNAQEPKKKPSWTDSMPERGDTPGMKMQIEDEEDDFGLDRSSLGFDRDEFSSPEDNSQESTSQQMTNKIEVQKQLDNERKKNAAQLAKIKKLEAEKLEAQRLEAQRLEAQRLEAQRLEAQKLEAQKLETQKLTAEKLEEKIQLEQEKIAAKKLTEQKLKNQKQNQEKITAQKIVAQKISEQEKTQQENKPKEIIQQKPKSTQSSNSSYKWKKIKNVAPIYPSKAARKKIEGWVEVEITVDSSGNVVDAKILRSKRNLRIFDYSALKAVKQWKYEPPSNYGIDTEFNKIIRLVYQL